MRNTFQLPPATFAIRSLQPSEITNLAPTNIVSIWVISLMISKFISSAFNQVRRLDSRTTPDAPHQRRAQDLKDERLAGMRVRCVPFVMWRSLFRRALPQLLFI